MTNSAQDRLARWPANTAVGLVIRGLPQHQSLRDRLLEALPTDPAVQRWWLLDEENQFVAEPIKPDQPDFAWTALLKLQEPQAAKRWLAELEEQSEPPCVYLAKPPPRWSRPILRLIQGTLNRFPLKLDPNKESDFGARYSGGVNPTSESQAYARTLPQYESIGVLNLHSYHPSANDPYTGEQADGRTIASRYLKRGFLTFTRVGGHVSFTATCRGQLLGPPQPNWQIVGLIWYPGRGAFASMSQDPRFARSAGYRKAGLSVASVSHCRVTASSEREDIRA